MSDIEENASAFSSLTEVCSPTAESIATISLPDESPSEPPPPLPLDDELPMPLSLDDCIAGSLVALSYEQRYQPVPQSTSALSGMDSSSAKTPQTNNTSKVAGTIVEQDESINKPQPVRYALSVGRNDINSLMSEETMITAAGATPLYNSKTTGSPRGKKKTLDRIIIGICAMDKKARSKPMAEILSRMDEKLFEVVFFGDHAIKNLPIEEWPGCNVLIAFFSKGYPLHKAMEYVALRKPLILNDLGMQELLQDRRRVYDLLEASGIDVPRHVYLSRDGYVSTGTGDGNKSRDPDVLEFDDHIEINGVSIHKPFVEKPVNAEGESRQRLQQKEIR
jgi:hypothetical protein